MAITYIKKISVADTVKTMRIGETQIFPYRVFKTETLRNVATRLNSKGFRFIVSTDGLTSGTRVTRLR